MDLKEFVKFTFEKYAKNGYCFRPRIVCNDGFSMSVQGSNALYCRPRVTQDWYDKMEIGYPSVEEIDIIEFAEDITNPTGTVYGYVPCELIEKVILKHGGINSVETFKDAEEIK